MEGNINMSFYCTIWHCQECGSPDLEISAWININTNEIVDSEGPLSTAWCPSCQEHWNRWDEINVPRSERLATIERARVWSTAYHAARS